MSPTTTNSLLKYQILDKDDDDMLTTDEKIERLKESIRRAMFETD